VRDGCDEQPALGLNPLHVGVVWNGRRARGEPVLAERVAFRLVAILGRPPQRSHDHVRQAARPARGAGRIVAPQAPAGVALGELGGEQRALALRLIELYARNMRSEIAEEELRRMGEAGIERVRFAWAGPIDPRQPHYYRMHGPTLLIEYDNSQNRANHIHSVWHDPRNDFGADLLRAHYERGHHHHA